MQSLATARVHEADEIHFPRASLWIFVRGLNDLAPGDALTGVEIQDQPVGSIQSVFPAAPGVDLQCANLCQSEQAPPASSMTGHVSPPSFSAISRPRRDFGIPGDMCR